MVKSERFLASGQIQTGVWSVKNCPIPPVHVGCLCYIEHLTPINVSVVPIDPRQWTEQDLRIAALSGYPRPESWEYLPRYSQVQQWWAAEIIKPRNYEMLRREGILGPGHPLYFGRTPPPRGTGYFGTASPLFNIVYPEANWMSGLAVNATIDALGGYTVPWLLSQSSDAASAGYSSRSGEAVQYFRDTIERQLRLDLTQMFWDYANEFNLSQSPDTFYYYDTLWSEMSGQRSRYERVLTSNAYKETLRDVYRYRYPTRPFPEEWPTDEELSDLGISRETWVAQWEAEQRTTSMGQVGAISDTIVGSP